MHAESAEPTAEPDDSGVVPIRPRSSRFASIRPALARVDLLFVALLVLSAAFRLYGVNWDQGSHIHPDERFLTMAGTATHLPNSIGQYLDPSASPLNPTIVGCDKNGCPYSFFVYGVLPLTVNTAVASVLNNDDYGMYTLEGRVLSAIADLFAIVFLYFIVRLLERRRGLPPALKYFAVALYGISVLPIQLSHFFATDTFLNLFLLGSLYFALRSSFARDWTSVALSGIFFGLAVACKTSAVYMLPLDLYFVLSGLFPAAGGDIGGVLGRIWTAIRSRDDLMSLLLGAVELILVFGLVSYLSLRLADPYYFQSANLLDPRLSQQFLHNIDTLNGYNNPAAQYPPGVQWIHKMPIVFALTNLAVFGLSVPIFLLVALGGYLVWTRMGRTELFVVLLWCIVFFLIQSSEYVKTMRYFIFMYPLLAIFAALGLHWVFSAVRGLGRAPIVIALLVWPLAFMSIYVHDHSRVQASEWMYRTLPNGSYIVNESWDDPLPFGVPNEYGKSFTGDEIPSFDPDLIAGPSGAQVVNTDKWIHINALLKRGRYLVLSSNRGWGSMPTVPERYPKMTQFYKDLFDGNTPYKLIATFTSYPSLRYLGIPIDFPDQWAEEAFTVYDHPEVMVFEHLK